jgi:hypothetical protein
MALVQVLQHLLNRYRGLPQDENDKTIFDLEWVQFYLPQSNQLVELRHQVPPIQLDVYLQLNRVVPFVINIFNAKPEEAQAIADETVQSLVDQKITTIARARAAVYDTLFAIHAIQVRYEQPVRPKTIVNQDIQSFIRPRPISPFFWVYSLFIVGSIVLSSLGGLSYLNQVRSIDIEIPTEPIEHIYGTDPDLSSIQIIETNHLDFKTIRSPQLSMLSDFDRFQVGIQTPTITYSGISKSFSLTTFRLLDTPAPFIENSILKWSPVENATSYNIKNNDIFFRNVGSVSLSLIAETNIVGNFSFQVQAVTNESYYQASSYSPTVVGTKLQPVTNLNYTDGQLVWTPIAGANRYTLEIGGVTGYQTDVPSYTVSLSQMEIDVYVTAMHTTSGAISNRSNKFTIRRLASVTGLELNNNILTWDPVEDSINYDVKVNGEVFANDITETQVSFINLGAGIYQVEVIANSGDPLLVNSTSGIMNYLLKSEITLNNNIVSWSPVAGATKYELYSGNIKIKEQFTSTPVDLTLLELPEGNLNLSLKVVRETGTYFEAFTPVINVRKFIAVQAITYNGTSINWNYDEIGVTFELTINGGSAITLTAKSYNVSLSQGFNTIEIRVKGFGNQLISSNWTTNTLNIGGRLASPEVVIERHPTQTNIWYIVVSPVAGADSYVLNIKYYTSPTAFSNSGPFTLSETTTMTHTVVSSGYVKMVVEVEAKSLYPLVFSDSLLTIVTKDF